MNHLIQIMLRLMNINVVQYIPVDLSRVARPHSTQATERVSPIDTQPFHFTWIIDSRVNERDWIRAFAGGNARWDRIFSI